VFGELTQNLILHNHDKTEKYFTTSKMHPHRGNVLFRGDNSYSGE